MNLKIVKEKLTSTEVIFFDSNEQSVELDYVLPDYCPEIFRILKCIAIPQIISYNIDGTKLTYEMAVCIRVLYCAENSCAVHTIDQKLTYSKKVDIENSCLKSEVKITPQLNFVNCRAVNPRRIDIRGAVSIVISVTGLNCKEVISDVNGGNIQLKKISMTFPSDHLSVSKMITVSDKFDIGISKPPIIAIIRNDAIVTSIEKKVISDKLIIKGEISINMLYTCQKENIDNIEIMQFALPFSQVIDIEGIDDRYECNVNANVLSCEIIPCSDGDGIFKVAECIVNLNVLCYAYKPTTAEFVVDEYSTSYKTFSEKTDISIESAPDFIDNVCVTKCIIDSSDNDILCIYDAWCTIKNTSVTVNALEKSININGTSTYVVLAKDKEEKTVILEKEEILALTIPVDKISSLSKADINIIPVSCSYTLSSDNTIELKTELHTIGCIKNYTIIKGITDITINEEELISKNNNFALKIYYTDENEDLWEIAKKYNTSISAIIEENEIEDDMITGGGMILIPIV